MPMPPSMEHVLVDKSVLFRDPDIFNRIRAKSGLPFIAHCDLVKLQSLTQGTEQVHQNARQFFRYFSGESRTHRTLPKGMALHPDDLLAEYAFNGQSIFALKRTPSAPEQEPGEVVNLCRHYDLLLLTCDESQLAHCKALAARAQRWTGPAPAAPVAPAVPVAPVRSTKPFDLPDKPLSIADRLIRNKGAPVTEGSIVKTSSQRQLALGKPISSGGEGTIHAVAGTSEVCKIYHSHKLTIRRLEKVRLMVTRKIDEPGICWPTELVFNAQQEFVGYVMPRAEGKTLQSSVFVKQVLLQNFTKWTRRDLVNIAIAFLKQVQYLHSLNIIVGDINPMNLLVTADSNKVWMVDTDSFQIGHFPCEVGTVPFTAPEIQDEKYGDYLRTKNHELFAIATMLFMILLPGKPPYSQQGGGTAADNIKNMNFPYRFKKGSGIGKASVTPVGVWQHIWSHLPYPLKQAFSNTFEDNQRRPISDWLKLLTQYGADLRRGKHSDDLFPAEFHITDPIDDICGSCKKSHRVSRKWFEKMKSVGKPTICSDCQKAAKLKKLAIESQKKIEQAGQRGAPPPAPAMPRPTSPPTPKTPTPSPRPAPSPKPAPAPAAARPAPITPQQQPARVRPQPRHPTPAHLGKQQSPLVRWFKRLLKRFL
ncbi:MAG TPA: hypothetical protein VNV36_14045 [Pseudomonas sp.]|nr:hypothetical protein [Pseudomonas sp.]